MKKYILLLLVALSINTNAQEIINSFNLQNAKDRSVFQVVDEKNNNITVFFTDKYKIKTIKFDENLKIVDSFSVARLEKRFNSIKGYSKKENKYFLYWNDNKDKEIGVQCIDLKSRSVVNSVIGFIPQKEMQIQNITVNNVFYMIYCPRDSNILKFYKIQEDKIETNSTDFSKEQFTATEEDGVTLYKLLREGISEYEPSNSMQLISSENPNSLALTAKKRKLYVTDNKLTFTFDNNTNFTQLLSINLNDYTYTKTNINQTFSSAEDEFNDNSNSFLVNEKLFQIKLNSDMLMLSVKDKDQKEISKYEAIYEKPITFKNSEILQENGDPQSIRVLEKSNQFIRKLGNMNPAISVYFKDGNYIATTGCVSTLVENNAALMAGMFGIAGVLIGAALSSNSGVNNLDSYNGRKVVYLNSKFDENGKHIDGELKPLAFDKLRRFAYENKKTTDVMIFKFKGNLYYGSCKDQVYTFYKFTE